MAEKDEDSLIGYDPLAWLNNAEQADTETSALPVSPAVVDEQVAESAAEENSVEGLPIAEPETEALSDQVSEEEPVAVEQALIADVQENAFCGSIQLEATQTIRNVAELHERLLNLLSSHDKIEIDASAVTAIDTATLQLLVVLKQSAINLQKEVSIEFPSDKFIEASELLDLVKILDVDQAFAGFF